MTPPESMPDEVARALAEDIGNGDVTADLIPAERQAKAQLITREAMVLAGSPYMQETFRQLDPNVDIQWHASEGDKLEPGACIATCVGPARALLTGERTALNFVQCLSAVATKTRALAHLLNGTPAALFDTRKTLPGLRMAQKYAVRIGGGMNHRIGLFDQVLIKENHIAAAGGLTEAVQAAKRFHPDLKIQVEVETIQELFEAFEAEPDIIMLDNFDCEGLKFAVQERNSKGLMAIELEASGGITADNLAAIGATGVDRISLGTLTKDISAIDLSMRVELS